MKKPLLVFLIVIVVALGIGLTASLYSSGSHQSVNGRPDLMKVERDPEVATAVLTAQHTLGQFIQKFQSPGPEDNAFGVRGKFSGPNGPEFIWVHLDAFGNSTFVGRLQDEPVTAIGHHQGDTVKVPMADVTDWIYRHAGQTMGGFTIQALQKKLRSG